MAGHYRTKSLLNSAVIVVAVLCFVVGIISLRWSPALIVFAAAFFIFGALSFRAYINRKLSSFKVGFTTESVDPNAFSGYVTTVFPARYINLGPVLDGDVYVGTCSSNFSESRHCFAYSSPDGIAWKLLKDFSDGIHTEVPIVFHAKRGLYATLHPNPIELWRSTNKGMTWDKVFSHATERTIYCLTETEDYLFFGTWPKGAIYRSKEGNEKWECVYEGEEDGFFSMLSIDMKARDASPILFAGAGKVMKSIDNGTTWHALDTPCIGPIRALFRDMNDSIIAIGDNGLIALENDGIEWESKIMNLVAGHLAHYCTFHKGYIYIGGDAGVVYRSCDLGNTWERFFEIPQSLNPKKKMNVRGITAWKSSLFIGTSNYLFSGDPRAEFYKIDLE